MLHSYKRMNRMQVYFRHVAHALNENKMNTHTWHQYMLCVHRGISKVKDIFIVHSKIES